MHRVVLQRMCGFDMPARRCQTYCALYWVSSLSVETRIFSSLLLKATRCVGGWSISIWADRQANYLAVRCPWGEGHVTTVIVMVRDIDTASPLGQAQVESMTSRCIAGWLADDRNCGKIFIWNTLLVRQVQSGTIQFKLFWFIERPCRMPHVARRHHLIFRRLHSVPSRLPYLFISRLNIKDGDWS